MCLLPTPKSWHKNEYQQCQSGREDSTTLLIQIQVSMILQPPDDSEESLTGHIQSLPFYIEDQQTGKEIKVTKIYVNSSHTEDKGLIKIEDDILFPNICIVAICQEGLFKGMITKNTYLRIRHAQTEATYSDQLWKDLVLHMFPTEESDLTEQLDIPVQVIARYISLFGNYDENLGYVEDSEAYCDDHVMLELQTRAQLPVTLGSLQLTRVDDDDDVNEGKNMFNEEEGSLEDYVNVFKWMELLVNQNKQLLEKYIELAELKAIAENEKEAILNNYNLSKKEFEEINKDLKNKFYAVLKSKKDRIWALQTALGQSSDTLPQSNENYYKGGGLVSTKFDRIHRTPTETSPVLKRQKVTAKLEVADSVFGKPPKSHEPVIKEEPLDLHANFGQHSFYGRQKGDSELVSSVLGNADKQETDEDDEENEGNDDVAREDDETAYEDSEEEEISEPIKEDEGSDLRQEDSNGSEIVKKEDVEETVDETQVNEDIVIEDSLGKDEGPAEAGTESDGVSESGTVYSEDEEAVLAADTTGKDELQQGTDYSSEDEVAS